MTNALEKLPSRFATFEQFMEETMTQEEAGRYCNEHPAFQSYGLRKTNPATGEGVSRYAVRPMGSMVADGRPASEFLTPTKSTKTSSDVAPVQSSKPKKIKVPGETRNGITSPSSTSVGFKIWQLCDELFSIRKDAFTKSLLLAEATNRGFNHGNALTECSRWRKFHGMTWKL
jgi:hypothetical protein